MSERPPIPSRADFRHFRTIPSRWMDNDVYGHINNVVYYSYFDTLVNRYLIDEAGLDFETGETICVVAETGCRYHRSFAYPEDVVAGLAIARFGRTSVRYELGLFGTGDEVARADGHFIHVFVERATMRPIPMPDAFRSALSRLLRPPVA